MEPKQRYKSGQGAVELQLLRPTGVFSAVVSGYLNRALGTAIMEHAAKLVGENLQISVFLDLSAMTGFDDAVRKMMRRLKDHYGNRMTVHILTGTRIHSLFLAAARLTLGLSLIGYSERSAYEEALRRALLERSTNK